MKKNVLLLVADQFRYDCQGYIGKIPVKTPNIDALSEDGIAFDNAYTSIPTCCPARQSFYACKRSESFGSYWNYNITMPIGGLPVDEFSFMRLFKDQGFETVHVGRSELDPKHGATEYGYVKQIDTSREYAALGLPSKKIFDDNDSFFDGWVEYGDVEDTLTAYISSRTIGELSRLTDEDKNFFMTVCYTCPHPPYQPHRSFYEMYDKAVKWESFDDSFEDKPYIQKQMLYNWDHENKTWEEWEPVVRRYYAQLSELDYHIGRIIAMLKEKGIYDDTVIVFTADHGDMCGSHRMFDKHYIMYEDVIHVPLVIKPQKGYSSFRTREYTVHTLDLGPTLMDLCGIDYSGIPLHGLSLIDVLEEGKSKRNEAVSTYNGSQFGLYVERAIKTDRWKYVWNPTDTDELYDLENDNAELVNRINDKTLTGILADLRRRLIEVLLREGDPFCVIGRHWAAEKQLEYGRKLSGFGDEL